MRDESCGYHVFGVGQSGACSRIVSHLHIYPVCLCASQLRITAGDTSIMPYVWSWLFIFAVAAAYTLLALASARFSVRAQLIYRAIEVTLIVASITVITVFLALTRFSILDVLQLPLIFLPTGWAFLQLCLVVAGAFPQVQSVWVWRMVRDLARLYEFMIGVCVFIPMGFLSWLPGIQDMQTRVLFNTAFSRGLQITRIIQGADHPNAGY